MGRFKLWWGWKKQQTCPIGHTLATRRGSFPLLWGVMVGTGISCVVGGGIAPAGNIATLSGRWSS